MTKSATRIQDKDTQRRLSVVQSTEDPTKYWIVILNPDGTPVQWGWGNVKGFALSSTSDITNAQKAYNWYKNGKVAVIIYNNKVYLFNQETGGNAYWCVVNEKAYDTVTATWLTKDTLQLAISSSTVTGITEMSLNINDFKVLRTDKDYWTPYQPQYDGSPATKKYVDDKVNDTAYWAGWDADTTHAPSKNAVYDKINWMISNNAYWSGWSGETGVAPSKDSVYNKINSMDTAIGGNTTEIATINSKIPSAATSSNQLADKDYVNDWINSVTAYYITKDAQGNQWATRAELFAATTFYSGWVVRVPTKNDYTIVLADEQHDNATTRYIYNNGWEYQYTVNETAMTQAQLDAINSWITAGKVSTYDGYATTISWKQDALTLPATPTQWHLVTWWANNKSLGDWWVIPTGVPSGWNNWDVLTNVSWTPSWQAPSGWDVKVSSQAGNILTSWMKIWAWTEEDYWNLGTYDDNTVYLTI